MTMVHRQVCAAAVVAALLANGALAPTPGHAARRKSKARPARRAAARPASKPKPMAKPVPAPKPAQPEPQVNAERAEFMEAIDRAIAPFTQRENGPGVVVCEPVAKRTDDATAEFGIGCGRWLHLVVSGHGEFGKTPTWFSVGNARQSLDKPDLRLTLEGATKLAARLGITHVALGEVTGTTSGCTLTYRIWAMPAKQPVGEPIVVSGTHAEVVAGLPGVATRLSKALGVSDPQVPPVLGESPEDLRVVAQLPWMTHNEYVSSDQWDALIAMFDRTTSEDAKRPPAVLTAFLGMYHQGSIDDLGSVRTAARVLSQALPENGLAYHIIASHTSLEDKNGKKITLSFPRLSAALQRFPHNHLYQAAESRRLRGAGRYDEARKAAESAVRCATGNPEAWGLLAASIFGQANAVRRARYISDMTGEQREFCYKRYEEYPSVCTRSGSTRDTLKPGLNCPGELPTWGSRLSRTRPTGLRLT